MSRVKLSLNDTTKDILVKMCEGNPGAATVIAQMDIMDVLRLDDLNMRGSQIWVGYKDFAQQNIEVFVEAVRNRNAEMIEIVNRQCIYGNHTERAK